jgi:hypothetical protein
MKIKMNTEDANAYLMDKSKDYLGESWGGNAKYLIQYMQTLEHENWVIDADFFKKYVYYESIHDYCLMWMPKDEYSTLYQQRDLFDKASLEMREINFWTQQHNMIEFVKETARIVAYCSDGGFFVQNWN